MDSFTFLHFTKCEMASPPPSSHSYKTEVRRFGGTYRFHLISSPSDAAGLLLAHPSTVMMEAVYYSEISVPFRVSWLTPRTVLFVVIDVRASNPTCPFYFSLIPRIYVSASKPKITEAVCSVRDYFDVLSCRLP
jgi:hypothetical protein